MIRDPFNGRGTGHRGRLLECDGHELVELASRDLRVTLRLTRCSDIIELRHKGTDLDLNWRGHEGIRRNRWAPSSEYGSGGWVESFAGGWQTVLPVAQFPARIGGAAFGLHGEVALLPWSLESVLESDTEVCVELSVELRRVPLQVRRRIRLAGATLTVRDEIENLSPTGIPFQFGHHIVFGEAVARPGSVITLEPNVQVEIPGGEGRYGDVHPGRFRWPTVSANDGKDLDLSRPCDYPGLTGAGAIGAFASGQATIDCTDVGVRLSLSWDETMLPYAWLWFSNEGCMNWPLWGRARLLGFEPFNSRVESIDEAREGGRAGYLGGGEVTRGYIAISVTEATADHG